MAWVYVDDHFPEHPKVMQARDLAPDAPWLFIAGLCYCRRQANGGAIPKSQIPLLVTRYKPATRAALVKVGLWADVGDGSVQVHDYAEWNGNAAHRSASARNAAQARWANERRNRQGGNPDA